MSQPETTPPDAVEHAAPKALTPSPHRVPRLVTLPTFLAGLIMMGAISAATSYWFTVRAVGKVLQLTSTPIAVLDANQVIHEAAADGGISGDRGIAALERIDHAAKDLASQGYIVLNSSSILAAPPQYFLLGMSALAEPSQQATQLQGLPRGQ